MGCLSSFHYEGSAGSNPALWVSSFNLCPLVSVFWLLHWNRFLSERMKGSIFSNSKVEFSIKEKNALPELTPYVLKCALLHVTLLVRSLALDSSQRLWQVTIKPQGCSFPICPVCREGHMNSVRKHASFCFLEQTSPWVIRLQVTLLFLCIYDFFFLNLSMR